MILVNLLALIALASTVVALMLTTQDAALDRAVRFREAARAAAVARAGELSAAAALRRDLLEAPNADHLREPWARVVQPGTAIDGGRFSLAVADAQGRFNLQNLSQEGPAAATAVALLERALADQPGRATALVDALRRAGPVTDASQLAALGLDPATVARLAPFVTRLPGPTPINLNTAADPLVNLLFEPAAAQAILAQRARAGFVTPADLDAIGAALPPGVGFTSNYWWVRTTVTIGGTEQVLTSLLVRGGEGGAPAATTLGRWWGPAAPDG